jgi:uncharacterized glyoxalase superfamily protein PhnB
MSEIRFASAAPTFAVADVEATIRWYEKYFGFTGHPFPKTGTPVFAIMTRDRIEIMLQRLIGYEKPDLYSQRPGGVWDAYIRISGVKHLFEKVRNEVTILMPLRQQPYGDWEFEVKDPNGYILVFSEFFSAEE